MCEKDKVKDNADLHSDSKLEISCFEDILEMIGTNGKKNVFIFIACTMCAFIGPFHTVSYQFLGATPEFWCDIPELNEANWTAEQIRNYSMPYDFQKDEYLECEIYDYNYTEAAIKGFDWAINNKANSTSTSYCLNRIFDPTVSSIVTDWDLVCERRVWYSTTQSIIQGGVLIASFVFGFLLDTFGRRPVTMICIALYIVIGFLTPLSNGILLYLFFKVSASFLAMGFYLGGFVTSMELCTPSQRSIVGNLYPVPWAVGYIITPIIAYLVRPWKWLQVALTAPSLILIANYWLQPESPRWLILHGKYDKAYDILKGIADANNKFNFPDRPIMQKHFEHLHSKQITSNSNKTMGTKDKVVNALKRSVFFISDPQWRVLSLVVFFCWFSVSMSYYGVSLGSGNLEISDYLYILIGGVLELPSYLMLWPAMLLLGRKKTLILFYISGGVIILTVMFLQIYVPDVSDTILTILSQAGKVAFTAGFQLVYVVTAELYPTHLRSLAVGISSFWARVGSMASPYINDLLGNIDTWIPSAVFGGFSFLSGVIALYIPETSNIVLPDNNEREVDDPKIIQAKDNKGFNATESEYL